MPSEPVRLSASEATDLAGRIIDAVQQSVVGKRQALELMLLGLLSGGHVLIEDFPGLAKTLMARSLAQVLGVQFKRVQFTPDLMPSDVTGSTIFNPQTLQFEFRPGPIFTNVLLADEINRAPAKTQAALLEAMQEGQVTVDGRSHPLPELFTVLATQNPIEYEGTYPLPEAQLDRFLLRLAVGYPAPEEELEVLTRRIERRRDELPLAAITGQAQVLALREVIERVHVDEGLSRYIVELVRATRSSPRLQVGASPRGSLALLKLARCLALLHGRDFVVPEDVKAVAVPALAHRLTLKPELWVQRLQPEDVVRECLDSVPAPPPD
ncbi:MAG: MoxR family ATPase [Candidatus Dormibacteraeota bacterium]|nr:MoxR family ATPase [Candidatus Dormibacteraeota bacterium]